MCSTNRKISLGITDELFDSGIHICQIYSEVNERTDAISGFIESGLKSNEKVACFSDKQGKGIISQLEEAQTNQFTFADANDTYFEGDEFSPNRMIALLKNFYEESLSQNFSGARVIGEMTKNIEQIKGGEKLLEYESRVNLLNKDYPITTVCQYNSHEFSGASILNILKVHPFMIIRGNVVHNPFYIPPEEFLS